MEEIGQRRTSLYPVPDHGLERLSDLIVYFKESFYEVYGYLGVMLMAFTLSFLAMVYMTVAQIIPNWTANFLMNTETLDNGEFLLISKPSLTIVMTSALMLSVFACLYLWLIVFMHSYNSEATVNTLAQAPDPSSLSYRLTQKFLPLMKRVQAQTGGDRTAPIANVSPRTRSFESLKNLSAKIKQTSTFSSNSANKLILDFTSMEGTYHRYYRRHCTQDDCSPSFSLKMFSLIRVKSSINFRGRLHKLDESSTSFLRP